MNRLATIARARGRPVLQLLNNLFWSGRLWDYGCAMERTPERPALAPGLPLGRSVGEGALPKWRALSRLRPLNGPTSPITISPNCGACSRTTSCSSDPSSFSLDYDDDATKHGYYPAKHAFEENAAMFYQSRRSGRTFESDLRAPVPHSGDARKDVGRQRPEARSLPAWPVETCLSRPRFQLARWDHFPPETNVERRSPPRAPSAFGLSC